MLSAPLNLIVDLALPPRCPACGAVVSQAHRLCGDCWGQLRFLGPPGCAACALPFDHDRGPDALCASCQRHRPRHAGVHAAVAYGDVARTLALRLKYGRRLANAETMARQMARLLPADTDLLIPVPLHRWRLWSRGFNQALLIAQAIGQSRQVPVARSLLIRTRRTPPLKGLGRQRRAKAVRGVFAVSPAQRAALRGKKVALVDDVYTSGATANACTTALLQAGAARVTIICWARVLDDATALSALP